MPEKTYLDANGNPAGSAPPVYLDPSTGEPITGHPADSRNWIQRQVDNLTTVTPEQEAAARNISAVHPQIGEMANQAQKFGAGAIQGLTQPFVHPLDTLSGIGHTIMHPKDSAKAMLQQAVSNPAGTLGNVVGGALLGEAAGPAVAPAARVTGKTAARTVLLGRTPAEAYETALKINPSVSAADRASIVQTALDNSIPVSKGGLAKLSDQIDTLNDAIKGEIAKDPNRPIDPNAVATRTAQTKQVFGNQVVAQPDLNAIEAIKQQFLAERGAQPGKPAVPPQPTGVLDAQGRPVMTQGTPATPPKPAPPMNAIDAQGMKQGTYNVLRGKYGEQGSATVEAQKALARGLKEEIANQFPEIGKLNAEESRLLALEPVLERAVNRIGNHQLIGIGTPVAGVAAEALTGSTAVGRVAMVMKGVLDQPMVKSRLAIAISKAQKIPYAQAVQKVSAYSSALGATSALPAASESSGNTPSQ